MTVLDNLTYAPINVKNLSKEEARAKVSELLARVGLSDKAHVYPPTLSGGQKQCVEDSSSADHGAGHNVV